MSCICHLVPPTAMGFTMGIGPPLVMRVTIDMTHIMGAKSNTTLILWYYEHVYFARQKLDNFSVQSTSGHSTTCRVYHIWIRLSTSETRRHWVPRWVQGDEVSGVLPMPPCAPDSHNPRRSSTVYVTADTCRTHLR